MMRYFRNEKNKGNLDMSMHEVWNHLHITLNQSMEILQEPGLDRHDVFTGLRYLERFVEGSRAVNPRGRAQLAAAEGAQAPSAQEMVTLAKYAHHAQLVYEKEDVIRCCLDQCGMVLHEHTTDVAVGRVAHYTAWDHARKIAVLSIKGTENLDEVITDVIADPEQLEVGGTTIYAHGGFARAALGVVEDIHDFIGDLPKEYTLIVTGHSLGAATANCVAKLLHARGVKVQCYGFATPPCLEHNVALSMAPFVTNVVHNDDAVTRASLANFKFKAKCIKRLLELLATGEIMSFEELDAEGSSSESWNKSMQTMAHMFATVLKTTRVCPEHNLLVPGRVVYTFHEQGRYNGVAKDGKLLELRYIFLSPTMMSDHACQGYMDSTSEIAGRLTGIPASDFTPWIKPEKRRLSIPSPMGLPIRMKEQLQQHGAVTKIKEVLHRGIR